MNTANDADFPILPSYLGPSGDPDAGIDRWQAALAGREPPFRPRFMVYSGEGTPRDTAERLQMLQALGAESFLLACDLPSQLGFDPDHRLARAEAGRSGVSCACLEDMREILGSLDLAKADSVGMLANSVGPVGFALLAEVLEEAGAGDTKVVLQNDPLKEFTARGTELFSPGQAVQLAGDVVEYALAEGIPSIPITVCSNHYDVAGAGPVVATAFALANALVYLEDLAARGLPLARVTESFMFFLNERSDFFIGAALFRAFRNVWDDLLVSRYGIEDPKPVKLMGYAHGLETREEPIVNVVRCTLSVAAAVLGGADYLCAAAYDEVLSVPRADAAALALRTLEVVGLEQGLSASVDALAGSAKLERLTEQLEASIAGELSRVEELGGAVACIENGYIASRITEGRPRRTEHVDSGRQPWVGVNTLQAPQFRHLFARPGDEDRQVDRRDLGERLAARICEVRQRADGPRLGRSLESISRLAGERRNVVPEVRTALVHGATGGQVMEAVRTGFSGEAG